MAKTKGALKPTKPEIARMKVLSELGLTSSAIARKLNRSHHTIKKYLESEVYNTPEIHELVEEIKEKEVTDLYLLGAKARNKLHKMLEDEKMKPIEVIATMDRAFQQRRILEGKSTENLDIHILHMKLNEIRKQKEELLKELELMDSDNEEGF